MGKNLLSTGKLPPIDERFSANCSTLKPELGGTGTAPHSHTNS